MVYMFSGILEQRTNLLDMNERAYQVSRLWFERQHDNIIGRGFNFSGFAISFGTLPSTNYIFTHIFSQCRLVSSYHIQPLMASFQDEYPWMSSQASNIALIPMKDVSIKAGAKRSVSSVRGGPKFVQKSFFTRVRDKLRPYVSTLLDFFDRNSELELPSDELYKCRLDTVMTTLIEHYMEFNNLGGSCKDVKEFWRKVPRGDYEEIIYLLTEMNIIWNTERACAMFNDKAVEMSLDINAAFTLMYQLLNGFSLDP